MSLAARVAGAIFWGQAGRLAETAAFFLFYLWLARSLGPAEYGVFSLGTSLAGACAFLALLGLGPETLGRFVPEIAPGGDRGRARRLLGILLAVRALAILAVAGAVFSLRGHLADRLHLPLLSASLALVLTLFAARSVFDLFAYFSSGLLDLKRVAAAKLIAAVAAPCFFLALSFYRAPGVDAAWLAIAAGLLAGILVLAQPFLPANADSLARAQAGIPFRRILAFGMFAWATNFFLYILGDNTDVLLLGWLLPDRAAIGCYALGARIAFSLTGVLFGWASLVSVATFSEVRQRGGVDRLARLVEAQWKLAALCMVGPFLLLFRYAGAIVAIFYSSAYEPAAAVVRILSACMIVGAVFALALGASALYAIGRERLACGIVAAVAAFNLVTEILLVPRLGILGAACATGVSFALLALLSTAACRRHVPLRFPAAFLGKLFVAATLALIPTRWIPGASLAQLAAGAAVWGLGFSACLALLRPLERDDSASLARVHPRLARLGEVFAPRAWPEPVGGAPCQR